MKRAVTTAGGAGMYQYRTQRSNLKPKLPPREKSKSKEKVSVHKGKAMGTERLWDKAARQVMKAQASADTTAAVARYEALQSMFQDNYYRTSLNQMMTTSPPAAGAVAAALPDTQRDSDKPDTFRTSGFQPQKQQQPPYTPLPSAYSSSIMAIGKPSSGTYFDNGNVSAPETELITP